MKILSCTQQKEADAYTIEHNSILSIDLMEKAASLITDAICRRWDKSHRIVVFAGPGNNGGDAVSVARMLHLKSYEVQVILFNIKGKISEDCLTNIRRLQESGFANYTEVSTQFEPPKLAADDIVIDGLFGTGLDRPLSGGFESVVRYINASAAKVVSIDIPSGMMGEDNTRNVRQNIIKADLTLTINLPKLSFLFAENEDLVGELEILDIGISKDYQEQTECKYFMTEKGEVAEIIRPRKKFSHKGSFGHALIIAGSYGMGGAAVLAGKSCIRSGVGLLTVHTPVCNHQLLQISIPEAMTQDDMDDRYFAEVTELDNYQALGIGPGLGQEEFTAHAIINQLKECYIPTVIDADAINALSTYRDQLNCVPKDSILTPHVRELERLVGRCSNSFERIQKAKDLASSKQIYIVLKGAWTTVITPDGECHFNPTGNPGMATGGSGDVLTGILTSLLAQGYTPKEASLLGVYLHGMAGDIAAGYKGGISMNASDIIDALPEAWKRLTEK